MSIQELSYRLGGRRDAELELAIDSVGRERVFARARELGWGKETPPSWVWRQIVESLLTGKKPGEA